MENKKRTLGIDLGTTYCAVAYVDEHGEAKIIPNSASERITPSVVFFYKADNIIVGQNAKDTIELSPDSVVSFVKREMGKNKENVRADENFGTPKPYDFFGKRYSPEKISSLILMKLKKDAETYFHGEEVKDVVITVPAYFNDAEKKATKDAGEMAGFDVLQVINEPTAAAISYGISKQDSNAQKVFVFDLGGGTFDVTVLDIINSNGNKEINIQNTDGDHRLGGKDWDDKIIEYIANEFINQFGEDPRDDIDSMSELRIKAEKIKKDLSQKDNSRAIIKTENNSLKVEITRDIFEDLCSDLMSRIEGLCEAVLNKCKSSWTEIDTILLTGGATRMPMVQELLKKISNKDIRLDLVNPDECVATGAAIHSTLLNMSNTPSNVSQEVKDKLGSIKVNDATSHTLGIVTVAQKDGKEINIVSPIINESTTTPCKETKMYGTYENNQSNILLQIKEGDSTNPDNTTTIQEATLPIIKPLPANSPIEVTFDIAADGMLTVIGRDVTNNQEIKVEIKRSGNISKTELLQSKNHLSKFNVS